MPQFELNRLPWPLFVYSYLELIVNGFGTDGQTFLREFAPSFEQLHADELRTFETITLRQQVYDNPITKLYRSTKYRIPLNVTVYYNLTTFLEQNSKAGGTVLLYLLATFCDIRTTQRGPIDQYSFEAIINQANNSEDIEPDLLEGIPGTFTGVTNKDIMINNVSLKLGPMPMDAELAADVRTELEEDDLKHPTEPGKLSLVEEFDRIKREDSVDAPNRNEIPFPPSRARDVVMEVQKVKESRDRFKIESRTGGIGPAVSVCMFTFHNSLDR